jgi:hypothetical protein
MSYFTEGKGDGDYGGWASNSERPLGPEDDWILWLLIVWAVVLILIGCLTQMK